MAAGNRREWLRSRPEDGERFVWLHRRVDRIHKSKNSSHVRRRHARSLIELIAVIARIANPVIKRGQYTVRENKRFSTGGRYLYGRTKVGASSPPPEVSSRSVNVGGRNTYNSFAICRPEASCINVAVPSGNDNSSAAKTRGPNRVGVITVACTGTTQAKVYHLSWRGVVRDTRNLYAGSPTNTVGDVKA